jgi:hypothetical protein
MGCRDDRCIQHTLVVHLAGHLASCRYEAIEAGHCTPWFERVPTAQRRADGLGLRKVRRVPMAARCVSHAQNHQ